MRNYGWLRLDIVGHHDVSKIYKALRHDLNNASRQNSKTDEGTAASDIHSLVLLATLLFNHEMSNKDTTTPLATPTYKTDRPNAKHERRRVQFLHDRNDSQTHLPSDWRFREDNVYGLG